MKSAKKPSLIRTLMFNIFLLFLFALLVITVVDMTRWLDRFSSEMERRRSDYITERKNKLQNDVLAARSLIVFEQENMESALKAQLREEVSRGVILANRLHDQYINSMGRDGVVQLIRESLRNIRFLNGRGYFFITDMKGTVVFNADKPELEGVSLWNLQAKDGTYTQREIIAVAQNDSGKGFYDYTWSKPGVEGEFSKTSYIQRIDKLNYLIGAGEYLDDFSVDKKKVVLSMLSSMENSNGAYLFAGQYDGISLIGPATGKNMWDAQDSDGKKVVQELIKSAKEGGGFVEYRMPRGTGLPPAKKISYVIPIPEWNWYLGTGVYIDDIDNAIAAVEKGMKRMILFNVLSHILLGVLLVLLIWFFIKRYSRIIQKDIDVMNHFFQKASKHELIKIHDHMYFKEMDTIARFAETMVEERDEAEQNMRLSDKLRAVGQLAGGVAHDFNNSLAAILAASEMAGDSSTSPEERAEFLNMIASSAERAGELTKKLLTFSRKGAKVSSAVKMDKVVQDAVLLLERTLDKKVAISIENKATKVDVVGDDTLLQNALINMGINAGHAMPQGGELTFSLENLILDEEYCELSSYDIQPGEYIAVAVRDTGVGMPLEVQHRIFEPFYTTKEEGKGTGLGLAAVYGTVVEHSGAITVYSEVNGGTVFHIYLPVGEGQKTSVTRRSELPKGTGTILLVDDEEIIRITTASVLKSLGYRVILAVDGAEGVTTFKENQDEIDLILLDMIMPNMGGREAFEKIREFNTVVPVVISSGFAKEEDLTVMKKRGIAGFLHKPFRREELAGIIASILHEKSE